MRANTCKYVLARYLHRIGTVIARFSTMFARAGLLLKQLLHSVLLQLLLLLVLLPLLLLLRYRKKCVTVVALSHYVHVHVRVHLHLPQTRGHITHPTERARWNAWAASLLHLPRAQQRQKNYD